MVILLALLSFPLSAQQPLHSPYLAEPERIIGYVDSCAAFWHKSYDLVKGGFYTNVDRSGRLIASWGRNKNMITQSRHAYGFVRAFMLTGKESYLDDARRALDFQYAHAWDAAYGGWFNELDESGNPTSRSGAKSAFNQHYALLGPVAWYEATRDSLDGAWMTRGYDFIDAKLWDSRPASFGYFDAISANATAPTGKSFNATVDAVTTHALQLYLMTGEERYKTRLLELADNMVNRLYASMPQQNMGFVEEYDSVWNPDNNESMTIMGHVLKTAWCLGRIQQLFPDARNLNAALALTQHVLDKGYDHEFGGPYKDYNRISGEMLMWGQADTAKAWWQMEQAITAGLMLYDVTRDTRYLNMADETLDFFMRFFVDHTYGEVYENRTRDGGPIWGDQKGGGGKAGYHSIELGYYVYLYGNLFVHNKPATLYYRFAPRPQARSMVLRPIDLAEERLVIAAVRRNGQPYANFDAGKQQLFLAADSGGTFQVTFAPLTVNAVAIQEEPRERRLRLAANYPNPFNAATAIVFDLEQPQRVRISVLDLRGREVAVLHDGRLGAGSQRILWNAGSLPSGLYLYRVAGEGLLLQGKMMLVR